MITGLHNFVTREPGRLLQAIDSFVSSRKYFDLSTRFVYVVVSCLDTAVSGRNGRGLWSQCLSGSLQRRSPTAILLSVADCVRRLIVILWTIQYTRSWSDTVKWHSAYCTWCREEYSTSFDKSSWSVYIWSGLSSHVMLRSSHAILVLLVAPG
jgi:hypothetical protein